MILKFKKIIDLDKGIVEVDDQEIINVAKQLEESKKVLLFVTEDGIDIFEGDEYFELITPNFHNKPCIWNILSNKTRTNINYDQKSNREHGRIWFSTKEKAEEYIIMNKPCLSINDVLSTPEGLCNCVNRLKELVKSKLK